MNFHKFCAENTWGAIKFLRECEANLLNEDDASVVMQARDDYSHAVEASLAAAGKGAPAAVGHGIRQAYHQVTHTPVGQAAPCICT